MADMRRELDALEARFPGLKARNHVGGPLRRSTTMPPSKWHARARSSRPSTALIAQYAEKSSRRAPLLRAASTGTRMLVICTISAEWKASSAAPGGRYKHDAR